MSAANSLEPPLDRLNYFNGQRLEAADLRVEQDYFIRVRRWLNRELYTWGIARGLEVNVKIDPATNKPDPHTLVVSPGLALDAEGREIILIEPAEVKAKGTPSTTPGVVFGNYLVISYYEERTAPVEDCCAVTTVRGTATVPAQTRSQPCGCGSTTAQPVSSRDLCWGAPSRIRAVPVVEMQDTFPTEISGKIVLAQIELDDKCAVRRVNSAIRKYVAAAQPPTVRPISLEGEKDIDSANAKTLYFHVQGGYPGFATLVLFATKFSSLFYTEMGAHTHAIALTTGATGHTHKLSLGTLTTTDDGDHRHEIYSDLDDGESGSVDPGDGTNDSDKVHQLLTGSGGVVGGRCNMEVTLNGKHHHTVNAGDATTAQEDPAHTHSVNGNTASAGQPTSARATGQAYTYVSDLHVVFDGVKDVTADILAQLVARFPAENWAKLGDGSATHPLAAMGTREIDLLQLGVDLSPGQHSLTFSVPSGGGQIHWNLYVG